MPRRLPTTGRQSIFRGKDKLHGRLQGILTPLGMARFEAARVRLARLTGRKAKDVSDGDTIEYLARGEDETRVYLGA